MPDTLLPPDLVKIRIASPAPDTFANDTVAELVPVAVEPWALCTNTGTGPLNATDDPVPVDAGLSVPWTEKV